jgi:DNA invertase Pin-like site-specific DNA recombinase
MKVKYNRVSTIEQSGNRFQEDTDQYDLTIMDRVSGRVPFKNRDGGSQIVELVESGQLEELVIEEYSRLGRNHLDCIKTFSWLDSHEVNVVIRGLGLQSRPGGKKNPVWDLISGVMSSLYQMELLNIKERTSVGRLVYVQNGGKLGRPSGSVEDSETFLNKPKSKSIQKYLKRGHSVREVSKLVGCSTTSVMKVKKLIVPQLV